MINPAVIEQTETLRARYDGAKPFRHLCIEDFFLPEIAEQALADFPAFGAGKAIDERGKPSGKAVVEDMASISPFYARLHEHVCGADFLAALSAITGVEALEADPFMFGGGTHDNRDGQELDPHIDFNFDPRTNRHRRMNLLVYLNKEWDPAWGGSIELHSNPRIAAENQITAFSPAFNRAVVFETNEHSWHGFPVIRLPDDRQHLSRKCISLYFYTQTRPAEEIAPPHGTHYVPRPIPEEILTPGRVLSEADVKWIRRTRRERDHWVAFFHRQELRMAGEMEDLRRALAHYKGEAEKAEASASDLAAELERLKSRS